MGAPFYLASNQGTDHFFRGCPGPGQEPSILKLEEPENIEARVDSSVVVVVGIDQPVVTGRAAREVNL
jgi:hypothetical protein